MSWALSLIFLLSAFFFPAVRYGTVPISITLAIALVSLCVIGMPRYPRAYIYAWAGATLYLAGVTATHAIASGWEGRDLAYLFLLPAHFIVFGFLKRTVELGQTRTLLAGLATLAIFELLLMAAQGMNLFGLNDAFKKLFAYYLEVGGISEDVSVLQGRPAGTLIWPPIAGAMLYLAFRTLMVYTGKRFWLAGVLVALLLTGWRTGWLIFLAFDVAPIVLARHGSFRTVTFLLIIGLFSTALLYQITPSPENFFLFRVLTDPLSPENTNEGLSVVNRIESLEYAFERWEYLAAGGLSSKDFLERFSIDSEVIQRSLQFGLVGFSLFVLINMYYLMTFKKYDCWFLLPFLLLSSITISLSSNILFFPFVLIYGVVAYTVALGEYVKESKDGVLPTSPGGATTSLRKL